MGKLPGLFALVLVAFGVSCKSSTPQVRTTPQQRFSLRTLPFEKQRMLDDGTYRLAASDLNLLVPQEVKLDLSGLPIGGYQVDMGVLRNPGGMFRALRSLDGKPLSADARDLVIREVKAKGIRVFEGGRIPYKYGPDGHSLLLMKGVMTYSPESQAEIISMSAEVHFPNSMVAKKACEYVEKETYHVRQKGSRLTLEFRAPRGAATDEIEAITLFGRQFGGSFYSLTL